MPSYRRDNQKSQNRKNNGINIMNSKLTEKRDYLFDNLKALMLFLVVIGTYF